MKKNDTVLVCEDVVGCTHGHATKMQCVHRRAARFGPEAEWASFSRKDQEGNGRQQACVANSAVDEDAGPAVLISAARDILADDGRPRFGRHCHDKDPAVTWVVEHVEQDAIVVVHLHQFDRAVRGSDPAEISPIDIRDAQVIGGIVAKVGCT